MARERGLPLPPTIPRAIQRAWHLAMLNEHPDWHPDETTWRLAAHALIQFFDAAATRDACALPSRAADSIWHVWLEVDPLGLRAWQQIRYGRTVDHHDYQVFDSNTHLALARCLVATSRAEWRSPVFGRLPLVFRVDGVVRMPFGFAYSRDRRGILHIDLDRDGARQGHPVRHSALAPLALAGVGLISAREAGPVPRRKGDGGGDGGSSCGSGDGCGGDGGCGCGSGCGSGCGGGCGS